MADLNDVALILLRDCLDYGADIDCTAVVSSTAFARRWTHSSLETALTAKTSFN
jgi:hypothetical protein